MLRTSNDLRGEPPDWDAIYCPPFSDAEDQLIRKILHKDDFNIVPARKHFGWFRFPDYAVEQLIIGCMACDIDLEVIEWKPS